MSNNTPEALPEEVLGLTHAFLEVADLHCPGLLDGLLLHGSLCWGEFFDDSDVDFVGLLSRTPSEDDLAGLAAAHQQARSVYVVRRFEGFHCLPAQLAGPPEGVGPVPVHYESAFTATGHLDVSWVTWHELAERGIAVRGAVPPVRTDLEALLVYCRENLSTYWSSMLDDVTKAGDQEVGEMFEVVVWVVLGVARVHHVMARWRLTSKSGAGRYVLEALDPRWRRIATEALRLRERPDKPSGYAHFAERGRDVREFLSWAVADGIRLGS